MFDGSPDSQVYINLFILLGGIDIHIQQLVGGHIGNQSRCSDFISIFGLKDNLSVSEAVILRVVIDKFIHVLG